MIVLLSAHPSTHDALDGLLQTYAGAKEVKKKEFKMKPKKASKHDFIEPGKAKVKKVCLSLRVCLCALNAFLSVVELDDPHILSTYLELRSLLVVTYMINI